MNNFKDEIDFEILEWCNKEILVPQSFVDNIVCTINYCTNLESPVRDSRKKRKWKSLAKKIIVAIVSFITCGVAYAAVTHNIDFENIKSDFRKIGLLKVQDNYEENKTDVNKIICENDYFKILLESTARDSAYTILRYKIIFTEIGLKTLPEINSNERDLMGNDTYNIKIPARAWLNGEDGVIILTSYADKISDSEFSYVQVINTIDYSQEDIEIKMWLDKLYIGMSYDMYRDDCVKINKILKMSIRLNKEKQEENIINNVISDTKSIRVNNIVDSKFEKYVDITNITENISKKEYLEERKRYEFNNYVLLDENENAITYSMIGSELKRYFDLNNEKLLSESEFEALDDNTKVRIECRRILALNKNMDFNKFKVLDYHFNIPNERTNDEKERFYKYDWKEFKEGEIGYIFNSAAEGSLTIDKIEVSDEEINVYYTQRGSWLNGPIFYIRKNNGTFNYVSASKIEVSGLNSFQNKAIFYRDGYLSAGTVEFGSNYEEYNNMLKDLENLQISVVDFSYNYKLEAELELSMPEEKIETSALNSIEVEDSYTTEFKIQENKLGRHEYIYLINFDKDNNILDNTKNRVTWFTDYTLKDINIKDYINNESGLEDEITSKFSEEPDNIQRRKIKSGDFEEHHLAEKN